MPLYLKLISYVFLTSSLILISCAAVNTEDNLISGNEYSSDYKEKSYESYYYFTLSKHAFYNQDLNKAIEYMEIAETSDPESAYLKYNLAVLYIASNLNEDAKEKETCTNQGISTSSRSGGNEGSRS